MTYLAPEAPARSRPALEGSLTELPLDQLLDLLSVTGQSGVIDLGDPVGATLWVREGHLAFGSAPGGPGARDVVVAAGLVTDAQFEGAVTATSPHQSLAETLVDLFDVDRDAVDAIAREQVITTVFEVLVVGCDRFEFYSGVPDPLGVQVSLPHGDILKEAERRRAQWQKIAELIPSTGIVVGLSRDLPGNRAGITITADEWQVLALLDGYRTVADVIAELGLSAFEVCGVLYELLRAGTARVRGSGDEDVIDVG